MFVPRASGKSFLIREGQSFRLVQPTSGQQVVDLNAFALSNPKEHFWAARTATLHGAHLSTGAELVSTPPRETPMLRIVVDTLEGRVPLGRPRPHDVFFGRCSRSLRRWRYGPNGNSPGCHEYLTKAISEFGLGSDDVHDAFNVFMYTWIDEDDKFAFVPSEAKSGDYVEMHALTDCIIAISACPGQSCGPDAEGILFEIE